MHDNLAARQQVLLCLLCAAALQGCGGPAPAEGVQPVSLPQDTCLPFCEPPPPSTLLSGVKPTSITLDASNAYFTNAFSPISEVDSVALAGGAKSVLASAPTTLSSVATSGGTLYWARMSGGTAGGVYTVPAAGGTVTQLSSHADDGLGGNQMLAAYLSGTSFATFRSHILFGDVLVAALYDTRLSFLGTSEASLLPATDPVTHLNYYPYALALDGSNVYFTQDSGAGVWRVALAGGAATQLVSGANRDALAAYAGFVYFQQGNDLKSVSSAGGPISTVAFGVGTISMLIARNGRLFWACGSCGNVMELQLANGSTKQLASSQSSPISLAADDTYVYFGTSDSLKRVVQ